MSPRGRKNHLQRRPRSNIKLAGRTVERATARSVVTASHNHYQLIVRLVWSVYLRCTGK